MEQVFSFWLIFCLFVLLSSQVSSEASEKNGTARADMPMQGMELRSRNTSAAAYLNNNNNSHWCHLTFCSARLLRYEISAVFSYARFLGVDNPTFPHWDLSASVWPVLLSWSRRVHYYSLCACRAHNELVHFAKKKKQLGDFLQRPFLGLGKDTWRGGKRHPDLSK